MTTALMRVAQFAYDGIQSANDLFLGKEPLYAQLFTKEIDAYETTLMTPEDRDTCAAKSFQHIADDAISSNHIHKILNAFSSVVDQSEHLAKEDAKALKTLFRKHLRASKIKQWIPHLAKEFYHIAKFYDETKPLTHFIEWGSQFRAFTSLLKKISDARISTRELMSQLGEAFHDYAAQAQRAEAEHFFHHNGTLEGEKPFPDRAEEWMAHVVAIEQTCRQAHDAGTEARARLYAKPSAKL